MSQYAFLKHILMRYASVEFPENARRVQQPEATEDEAHRDLRISTSDRHAEEARRGEWTATPPGRLGRRLVADIELYLEFFAIARAD